MICRNLPFYEFRPGIFEVDEFDCVSCFVVVGEKSALLLDVGTGIGDLRWVVENRITDKPYQVVASHNHGDHVGGAGFFDEIWIHRLTKIWIRRPLPLQWSSAKIMPRSSASGRVNTTPTTPKPISSLGRKSQSGNPWRTVRCSIWAGAKVTALHCPDTRQGRWFFWMTRPTPFCAVTPATAIGCSTRPWRRRCGSVPRYR